MSKDNLQNLRSKLKSNYQDLFSIVLQRRELIEQINQVKSKINLHSYYDLDQEMKVFKFFSHQIKQLSLEELLSLSLLIQSHVQISDHNIYPNWSRGDHLLQIRNNLLDQCNPVLIFIWNKDVYREQIAANLTQTWKNKLQHLMN